MAVEQQAPSPTPLAQPASTENVEQPAANPFEAINHGLERLGRVNRVSAAGRTVWINGDDCDDALMRRIAFNPAALEILLRERIRFIRCERSRNEIRVPLPGSIVPASIDWDRSLVMTPTTMSGAGRPAVFCTRLQRAPLINCARTLASCMEHHARLDAIEPARACVAVRKLWCFDTGGTELQCSLTQRDCDDTRDESGPRSGECSERWAL